MTFALKKSRAIIISLLLPLSVFSQQFSWTQKASIPTFARTGCVSFAIGDNVYVGTGVVFVNGAGVAYNDFWQYNTLTDTWTQISNAGNTSRWGASSFTIGSNGYIGTGWSPSPLNDFVKYDPAQNNWTSIASLPAQGRYHGFAFSIGNIGYFGTGYNGNLYNDFWQYDPLTNIWAPSVNFGGGNRMNGIAFGLGNYGYSGMGWNSSNKNDFWRFDPTVNSWTQMSSYPGQIGYAGASCTLNGKAYAGLFFDGSTYANDWWEYDPATNVWTVSVPFPGTPRANSACASTSNRGFIASGENNQPNFVYFNDMWEFSQTTSIESVHSFHGISLSQTPASLIFQFENKTKEKTSVLLYTMEGKEVANTPAHSGSIELKLDKAGLAKGLYFYCILENNAVVSKNKFYLN